MIKDITDIAMIVSGLLAAAMVFLIGRLSNQISQMALVARDTHTLVNSNMGTQLKISAVALAQLAAYTKNPEDAKAAKIAQQALEAHEAKQKAVDEEEVK